MDNIIKTMQDFQKVTEKFQKITEYIAHLEQGILDSSIRQQRTELINTVLFEILVTKELVTKKEVQTMIEEKVNKPIQAYVQQIQEMIQANTPQIKKEVEEKVQELVEEAVAAPDYGETEECMSKLDTSNVVLASERFNSEK